MGGEEKIEIEKGTLSTIMNICNKHANSIKDLEDKSDEYCKSVDLLSIEVRKLNRSIFGDKELDKNDKGIFGMTKEMYESLKVGKGSQKAFWMIAKIGGAIIAITGGFWAIVEVLKKLIR